MKEEKILLKDICAENESVILDILTSDVVSQTYMVPDYTNRSDALPLFYRLIDLSRDRTRFVRGIFLERQLIGFLNDVDIKNRSIELGYVIHPDYHGKGYMTQALAAAITELAAAGYREIIAGAFRENAASIRVMEKSGMVKMEKEDEIEYRGKVHKCVYYHVLKA